MDEDFADDLLADLNKKTKKLNSGRKGRRVELELAKLLNNRFGKGFSRSVGSGNRWSQTSYLPKHAQEVFSGDLVCPENFKFVLESKGGYDDIDFNNFLAKGLKDLDSFLKQVSSEAERCGRKPLLLWKKTRRSWVAFLKAEDLPITLKYGIIYKDWLGMDLKLLLGLSDDFFFAKN